MFSAKEINFINKTGIQISLILINLLTAYPTLQDSLLRRIFSLEVYPVTLATRRSFRRVRLGGSEASTSSLIHLSLLNLLQLLNKKYYIT